MSTNKGKVCVDRISDVRFTGAAVNLLAMCGDQALCDVIIVTNMLGKVTPEVGVAQEQELASDSFKPGLDNETLFHRHNDTTESVPP
jgi:hypothetical protein